MSLMISSAAAAGQKEVSNESEGRSMFRDRMLGMSVKFDDLIAKERFKVVC